jgi:DNA-binding Lrp family transcriptional regulator
MNPRSENPREEGPYAWQTREAAKIAGQLGPNHYAVYHALTHFQSAAGTDQKRRFAASYEQLADHIGASKNTVSRCLPDLEKAGLIRLFSGANGGLRATRNAFCLLSISHPSQGHGNPSQGEHVKPCGGQHVKPSQVCKKRLDNRFIAAPQGSAYKSEKNEKQPACSPLRGGSGPRENPDIIHDFSHLPERERNYMVMMRAIAAEADAEIAEQIRKKREAERNS